MLTLEHVADDALAVLDAVGVERAASSASPRAAPPRTMLAAVHPDRVSAMVQYGAYARVTQAADYPEGLSVDVVRAYHTRMLED